MIVFAFVFGYLTLLIELVFFHVPSVANTQNFFQKNNNYVVHGSTYISKIYGWAMWKKVLVLAVPFFFINIYFLLPFLYFFPDVPGSKWLVFKTNDWLVVSGVLFVVAGRIVTFGSMLFMRRKNKQTENSFKLHTNGILGFPETRAWTVCFYFLLDLVFCFPVF
jgi:hypothetical protein